MYISWPDAVPMKKLCVSAAVVSGPGFPCPNGQTKASAQTITPENVYNSIEKRQRESKENVVW